MCYFCGLFLKFLLGGVSTLEDLMSLLTEKEDDRTTLA